MSFPCILRCNCLKSLFSGWTYLGLLHSSMKLLDLSETIDEWFVCGFKGILKLYDWLRNIFFNKINTTLKLLFNIIYLPVRIIHNVWVVVELSPCFCRMNLLGKTTCIWYLRDFLRLKVFFGTNFTSIFFSEKTILLVGSSNLFSRLKIWVLTIP